MSRAAWGRVSRAWIWPTVAVGEGCSEAEGVTRPWSVVFDSRSRVGIEAPERFPWETEGLQPMADFCRGLGWNILFQNFGFFLTYFVNLHSPFNILSFCQIRLHILKSDGTSFSEQCRSLQTCSQAPSEGAIFGGHRP